eukprot:6877486-Prorocentrum_lima.AAC.1
MNIPQKEEVLNNLEARAKEMRRKEQQSKPLTVRMQQVTEAMRNTQGKLVDNNLEQLKFREETNKKEKEAEELRKKYRELEEDQKQIQEALEEETTAEYIE